MFTIIWYSSFTGELFFGPCAVEPEREQREIADKELLLSNLTLLAFGFHRTLGVLQLLLQIYNLQAWLYPRMYSLERAHISLGGWVSLPIHGEDRNPHRCFDAFCHMVSSSGKGQRSISEACDWSSYARRRFTWGGSCAWLNVRCIRQLKQCQLLSRHLTGENLPFTCLARSWHCFRCTQRTFSLYAFACCMYRRTVSTVNSKVLYVFADCKSFLFKLFQVKLGSVENADSVGKYRTAPQRRMSLRTALTEWNCCARRKKRSFRGRMHFCCRGESGGEKNIYVKNDMMK